MATASLLILIWPGRRIWPGGRIGAGGLIRSSAELLAIAGGLELAWDREYRKIICHSDTNNVIRSLSADQVSFHKYMVFVFEIRELQGLNCQN